MSTSAMDKDLIYEILYELEDVRAKQAGAVGQGTNIGAIPPFAPTNSQGAAAAIVAVISLVCKYTGVFRWTAAGLAAAEAPADLVDTWTVSSDSGVVSVGGPTYTGAAILNNAGPGVGSLGFIPSGALSATTAVSTAGAGTSIVVSTGGGGGVLTQCQKTETIGTAAVGSSFFASGIMVNSITEAALYTPGALLQTAANGGAPGRFALGTNVFLRLTYQNSNGTNRALTQVSLSLEELKGP